LAALRLFAHEFGKTCYIKPLFAIFAQVPWITVLAQGWLDIRFRCKLKMVFAHTAKATIVVSLVLLFTLGCGDATEWLLTT